MNILITAPSLNPSQNVSGVSTMVNTVIQYNKYHHYFHYQLGRLDKSRNKVIRVTKLIKQLLFFPIFLIQNKIEVVHQNLPLDPKGVVREYIINLWCRFNNIPVVLHVHGGQFITLGTENRFFKKLAQSLFIHSKQVIVLSELEQKVLEEKFGFTTAKVLSNSIDISIYHGLHLNQLHERPKLLYLGRIEKDKGIVELVEALKLLKKDVSFHFILCGTGTLVQYCINECGIILGDDFEYKGVVSGDDKINVIKYSDLFILPSYFEGLPMALLETMSAGVVPIVTNVGSMKHVISHGINGFLVNKEDTLDLYEKLRNIIFHPESYPAISKNASNTIAEKFDIKNYILQLNQIYEAAIITQVK